MSVTIACQLSMYEWAPWTEQIRKFIIYLEKYLYRLSISSTKIQNPVSHYWSFPIPYHILGNIGFQFLWRCYQVRFDTSEPELQCQGLNTSKYETRRQMFAHFLLKTKFSEIKVEKVNDKHITVAP